MYYYNISNLFIYKKQFMSENNVYSQRERILTRKCKYRTGPLEGEYYSMC